MNQSVLVAMVAVLVLASCHPVRKGSIGADGQYRLLGKPDSKNAEVYVDDDTKKIFVNQEPLHAKKHPTKPGKKQITWHLESSYEFPETGGIEFCSMAKPCSPPAPPPDCTLNGSRTKITCEYDAPPAGTKYRYTIRVKGLDDLDPSIWN